MEKSLPTESTQLYQKHGMDTTGTAAILPYEGTETGWQWWVTASRYLLGSPKWGLVVLWHKSLAMAPTWEVCPWCLDFPWEKGITSWKQWQAPSPSGQKGTLCLCLAWSFGCSLCSTGFAYTAACTALVQSSHEALRDIKKSCPYWTLKGLLWKVVL